MIHKLKVISTKQDILTNLILEFLMPLWEKFLDTNNILML